MHFWWGDGIGLHTISGYQIIDLDELIPMIYNIATIACSCLEKSGLKHKISSFAEVGGSNPTPGKFFLQNFSKIF